jgi:hypothetical protein
MDIEETKENLIPTITERLKRSYFSQTKILLSSESPVHNHSHLFTQDPQQDIPLNMTNITKIQKSPKISLTNLVLNEPLQLATELEKLSPNVPKLLIDVTRPENGFSLPCLKKIELASKTKIGWTYLPKFVNISENTSLKEVKLVLTEKRVFKKIEHESFDESNSFIAIGPLKIGNVLEENHYENLMFKGIEKFSKKYDCPVVIDLEEMDSDERVLKWVGEVSKESNFRSKIFFINFSVKIQRKFDFVNGIVKEILETNLSDSNLDHYLNLGYKVQFPVMKFRRLGISTTGICSIIREILEKNEKALKSLLISSSVEYKIDTLEYGGEGLPILSKIYEELEIDEKWKSQIFKENVLDLFCWWNPPEKEVDDGPVVNCHICGNGTTDTSKWLSKNGLFFDKIPCFKQYIKSLKK